MNKNIAGFGVGNVNVNNAHLNPSWNGYDQNFPKVPIEYTAPAAGANAGPIFDGRAFGKGRILGGSAFTC